MSTNSSTKKQYLQIRTPLGIAVYPKLDTPRKWSDLLNRSVDDIEGKLEISVAFDATPAEKLKGQILDWAKTQGLKKEASLKNVPWKDEVDKVTDDNTGRVLFKFTNYGTNRDGSLKRIPHWNAAATKVLGADFKLTSGSEIKVAGSADYYVKGANSGIRLIIDAVQVLKYVEREERNPGFEAAAGYEGEEDVFARDEENDGSTSTDF